MNRRRLSYLSAAAALGLALSLSGFASAYPKPSLSPTSWELKFEPQAPRRIVVSVPGQDAPKAYWYITYTVTNNSGEDQTFLPTFEWVTNDGKVIRSDKSIPPAVFEKIKATTGNKLLQDAIKISGQLRQGDDEAKDGVAIWEEPSARLGNFNIFITGLSGEAAQATGQDDKPLSTPDGKPVLLFKTLEQDFKSAGDEVYPGNDLLVKLDQKWVMR